MAALDLGPHLELVFRSHAQQAQQLAADGAGHLVQRPHEMRRPRHQPVLYVLTIVDHEVDHLGDLADRDQQAGARRGAIDQDLVAGRAGQRNEAFDLGFLPLDAADKSAQQVDRRRRIGKRDRAGDGAAFFCATKAMEPPPNT